MKQAQTVDNLEKMLHDFFKLKIASNSYSTKENIGLATFSITPVQAFIANARKTKDYWTGSVLLSYLTFCGIKWVIENLGPDHIVYPCVVNQPLVNLYLQNKWNITSDTFSENYDIASFPNKFTFFIPLQNKKEILEEIQKTVFQEWQKISVLVCEEIVKNCSGSEKQLVKELFIRQTDNFWDFSDSTVRYNGDYSQTHTLVQKVLASKKLQKTIKRQAEEGEKCVCCGEFEIVNYFDHTTMKNQSEGYLAKYNKSVQLLWEKLQNKNEYQLNSHERLCSICLIKRLFSLVSKNHFLAETFKNDSFPSTPEFALYNYKKRNQNKDIKNIAQQLFEAKKTQNGEKITDAKDVEKEYNIKNEDKYYAILLMDGDNMGKLINGKYLKKDSSVTSALHNTITQSLGDFSIILVPEIINKHGGKLVYAGGDDVCALMPIDTVLQATQEIQEVYKEKLSVRLENTEGISISAGILLCHYKENLKEMIMGAHHLLDGKAKQIDGKNACAIELKKRSGGSRYFCFKWDEKEKINSFNSLIENMSQLSDVDTVSRSFVYKLNLFDDGLVPLKDKPDLLKKFLKKQLSRTGENQGDFTQDIAGLIFDTDGKLTSEPLIIASFLAKRKSLAHKKMGEQK